MENMPPVSPVSNRKVIKVSRKKLAIWIIVILVILGFVIFAALSSMNSARSKPSAANVQVPCIESYGVNCGNSKGGSYTQNYYPNTNTPDITDTREFLKVSYSADLKTRNVASVMHDVKNAIEIADGRMDNLTESTKYGRVNFIVPKSNFESFKEEIESLTNKKLITETTSSQNLLTQKQSIEQQTEIASNSLLSLQQKQQAQTTAHNKKIADLQNQLKDTQIGLAVTQAEYKDHPNNDLKEQVTMLTQREATTKQSIAIENSTYAANNQNLQNQINSYNSTLVNLGKQDVKFTDNIETVNGYISVSWISWWNILKIFSPIHPTFLIIILIIVLWLCIRRKSYVPKVEFI